MDPVLELLVSQGWSPLKPLLTPDQVESMREYLHGTELVASNGIRFTEENAPRDVSMASYPLSAVLCCPHVRELMNNNEILRIAAAYFGCRPTISGLRIDWSCPTQQPLADIQRFHRDYDDWKQIKLFIYLTDVDDDAGPHEFIATSHRDSGRLRARPYQDQELARTYGADNFVRVKGPRGTCFMVDTWGVHKGNVPVKRPRLLLQVQYSLLPIVNFDYRPASLPRLTCHDSYSNRLLIT
jgi:hypothetical protein